MTTQDEIERRRREILQLEQQQRSCPHSFDPAWYDPRKTGGHQVEDGLWPEPGRMVWLPEKIHPRWARRCTLCGLVEKTERTRKISRPGSIPGTTTTEEIPDFGDERRPTMRIG